MNKATRIGLIAVIVLLAVVMVWFSGNGSAGSEEAKPPYVSANWVRKFQLFDKDPYGLYLFNTLLTAHLDTGKTLQVVPDWIALDTLVPKKEKSTLVFTGSNFGLQNNEFDSILKRVEEGCDLLLSYHQLTDNLNQRLFEKYELTYDYADSVKVFTEKAQFTMISVFQNDTVARQWNAFAEVKPKDTLFRVLSSFMELPDLLMIRHGKGTIYLHTNPEFFFNYQLKRRDGFRYAGYLISKLSPEREVFLLELGRLADNYGTQDTDQQDGTEGKVDDSYLQFLLKSPALVTAMGLIVLGLILFVLFRARRMRPIIPYLPRKKNMSMAFADTITSIYLSKQNPYGLLHLQKKNFMDAIHRHYYLDLGRNLEDRERLITALSQKSGVPEQEILVILQLLETTEASRVNEDYIARVSRLQYEFYQRAGIIPARVLHKIQSASFVVRRELLLSSILVLTGTVMVVTGLYFLTRAMGFGILLWPVGGSLIAAGILRLSRPMLHVTEELVTFYPVYGRKRSFSRSDLTGVKRSRNACTLLISQDRSITLFYREMSRFDRGSFDLFISGIHQIE